MITRNNYLSLNTTQMLGGVFPDNYKLVTDPNSNGYRFVNAWFVPEFDLLYNQIEYATAALTLEDSDISYPSEIYECLVNNNITAQTISGIVVSGAVVPITISDKFEFFYGTPTRVKYLQNLQISGVVYGLLGLEYIRSDQKGSGYLMVGLDDSNINLFGNSYEVLKVPVTRYCTLDQTNISGFDLAVQTQDFSSTGFDEILEPETRSQLEELYPLSLTIKDTISGISTNSTRNYVIDHYTPDYGYAWDPAISGYKALHPNDNTYYDDQGIKKYYRTALNNPNGSGIFDTVYVTLQYTPLSGTLQLFDINNLSMSGTQVEIASSGTQLYYYSGIYTEDNFLPVYIGYEQKVPVEYLADPSIENTGIPYLQTSWDYCRLSGGLNSDFVWEEFSSNPITNRIKIVNPISKYLVTYKYLLNDRVKFISSNTASKFVKLESESKLYTQDTDSTLAELPWKESYDPDTSKVAITFDGLEVRPGSAIKEIDLDLEITLTSTFDRDVSINLENEIIGYNKTLVPAIATGRSRYYLVQETFDGTESLTLNNSGCNSTYISYNGNIGTRQKYNSLGSIYYSGVFVGTNPTRTNDNRYFRFDFRFNSVGGTYNLMQAANSDGSDFLDFSIDTNGLIILRDVLVTATSLNKLELQNIYQSIIIERAPIGVVTTTRAYRVFLSVDGSFYRELDMSERDSNNTTLSGNYSYYFKNTSLDLGYISIYDEIA